jgi:hypothetical protein
MLAAILAAVACHVGGQAPFLRPDDDCTPGAYKNLTLAQACVHTFHEQASRGAGVRSDLGLTLSLELDVVGLGKLVGRPVNDPDDVCAAHCSETILRRRHGVSWVGLKSRSLMAHLH